MTTEKPEKLYQGRRQENGAVEILVDGHPLDIEVSLAIIRHSPTGFEWGYGGSGPAQSALAVLFDYTGDRDYSERHHQAFKEEFLAKVNPTGWALRANQIDQFIASHQTTEGIPERRSGKRWPPKGSPPLKK